MSNPNLMKYFVVDVNTGRWISNKEKEHHSIATPKMLNNLELRLNHLLAGAKKTIEKGMMLTYYNRNKYTNKVYKKIDYAKEEINSHLFFFSDFKLKVEQNLHADQGSPLMKLKKMDSPLRKGRKLSISHVYERIEDEEVMPRLNVAYEGITKATKILTVYRNVWTNMLELMDELDASRLYSKMKEISKILSEINVEYFAAFFLLDDVTRGLLKKGVHIKVNLTDVMNKLLDLLVRTFLKGIDNYRRSEESKTVENVLFRLKELDLYNIEDMNIQVLLDLKILLDTEPNKLQSVETNYEICYKKVGELHVSIHSKMFCLHSLSYLRKYFPFDLRNSVDSTVNQLTSLHTLISKNFVDVSNVKNEVHVANVLNVPKVNYEIIDTILPKVLEDSKSSGELEVYIRVIEDMMMESDPGKEYFTLNNKLHKIHNKIGEKYSILNKEDLFNSLKVIGSTEFINFISACENLILELRKELKKNQIVNLEDIQKVGIATGKTTMITTYHKAIDEILATLGTFLANTLHVLVQEMLINIPISSETEELRKALENTYRQSEYSLHEINQDSLSDSL
jgi:hypothetical protein